MYIYAVFVTWFSLVATSDVICESRLNPIAVLVNGGTASSKSSSVREALYIFNISRDNITIIDADEIMMSLPEYNGAAGPSPLCKASNPTIRKIVKKIKSQMIEQVLRDKSNVLIDATMDNYNKSIRLIDQLVSHSYEIVFIGVTMDIAKSIWIAHKRALKIGRYVPLKVIISSHQLHSQYFGQYIDHLKNIGYGKLSMSLFDTNILGNKRAVITKAAGLDSTVTYHNMTLYNNFIQKQFLSLNQILNAMFIQSLRNNLYHNNAEWTIHWHFTYDALCKQSSKELMATDTLSNTYMKELNMEGHVTGNLVVTIQRHTALVSFEAHTNYCSVVKVNGVCQIEEEWLTLQWTGYYIPCTCCENKTEVPYGNSFRLARSRASAVGAVPNQLMWGAAVDDLFQLYDGGNLFTMKDMYLLI
eukprot:214421_1